MILCPTLSEPDCALVFNTMDINRDDQITFTEFLSATLNPEAVDIAELNDAFSLLDSNNDGFISLDEIRQIYSFKHMKKKRPVHRRVDTNDSGGQSDSPATSAKLADSQSQSREGRNLPLLWMRRVPRTTSYPRFLPVLSWHATRSSR